MQRLRETVLRLPSPALFQSWRIKVLDNYIGSFQEAIADMWREKFSNVNVAMRNVNNSLLRNSKLGILCTVALKLSRRPTHIFALM